MTSLSPEKIKQGLQQKTAIYYFPEISSTQTKIKQDANHLLNPSIYISDYQTAGKGRKQNKWFAKKGDSIALSLLLKPIKTPNSLQILPLMMAAAFIKAASTWLDCQIKWPNDIVYQGKKIAGILSESTTNSDHVQQIIIGIGINTKLKKIDLPADIANKATSFAIELGETIDENQFLIKLLNYFDTFYQSWLATGNIDDVLTISREHSAILNKTIYVIDHNKQRQALAKKIDMDGILWVQYVDEQHLSPLLNNEISIRGLNTYI